MDADFIKSQLNFGSRGSFLDLRIEECKRMLERLAYTSKGWSSGREGSAGVAATTNSDSTDLVSKQLMLLNQKIDNMRLGQMQMEPQAMIEDVNYVHQGGYQRNNYNNYCPNHGGGNYQTNRSHPNLSYGNLSNALQPPLGFSVTNGAINEPTTASPSATTDELLRAFMGRTPSYMESSSQRLDKVEGAVVGMSTQMKILETQMSQIAQAMSSQHKPGQFPGQPNVNPKDCKAINLRSGTSYEGPPMPETTAEPEKQPKKEAEGEPEKEEPVKTPAVQPETSTSSKPTEVKVPFPQMLQKKKKDEQFSKFLDIFRKVQKHSSC